MFPNRESGKGSCSKIWPPNFTNSRRGVAEPGISWNFLVVKLYTTGNSSISMCHQFCWLQVLGARSNSAFEKFDCYACVRPWDFTYVWSIDIKWHQTRKFFFSQPRVDGGQNHAPTFGIFSFYQVVDRCQQWNFIGWLTLKHWHGRDLKITKFEGTFNFTRLKVRSLLLMFCSFMGRYDKPNAVKVASHLLFDCKYIITIQESTCTKSGTWK